MNEEQQPRKDTSAERAKAVLFGERIAWHECDAEALSRIHYAILAALQGVAHQLVIWSRALAELEDWKREVVADQIEAERRRGFHRPPPGKKC